MRLLARSKYLLRRVKVKRKTGAEAKFLTLQRAICNHLIGSCRILQFGQRSALCRAGRGDICPHCTVRVAVFAPPFADAEICTVVEAETGFVVKVNCTLDVPFNAVTVLGMLFTAPLPLTTVNVTGVSELRGTGKVIVPVLLPPPTTEVGEKLKAEGRSAVTVNAAVFEVPLAAALTFTCVLAETECTVTVQGAVEKPAGTVTLGGMDVTTALPARTVRATCVSVGTAAFIVTVPVTEPANVDLGENDTAVT